tara:strand:+ start:124 stop:294 length:171 start_codon:yes stop_codon:yes gene_type:complete
MTRKQRAKTIQAFLIGRAKDAATEAQKEGISEDEKNYFLMKSIMIRDLIKDLKDEK